MPPATLSLLPVWSSNPPVQLNKCSAEKVAQSQRVHDMGLIGWNCLAACRAVTVTAVGLKPACAAKQGAAQGAGKKVERCMRWNQLGWFALLPAGPSLSLLWILILPAQRKKRSAQKAAQSPNSFVAADAIPRSGQHTQHSARTALCQQLLHVALCMSSLGLAIAIFWSRQDSTHSTQHAPPFTSRLLSSALSAARQPLLS